MFRMVNRSLIGGLLLVLVWLFILIYFIQNGIQTAKYVYRNFAFVSKHIGDSYDDKMKIYWWTVYDYLQFIKQQTPANATIVIPPQERPWLTSGNVGLVRYFLYPRRLINGSLVSLPDVPFDYITIVHGEWADAPPEKYGWPKIPIAAQRIIYFNPQSKESTVSAKNYDPNENGNMNSQGLIEIKK